MKKALLFLLALTLGGGLVAATKALSGEVRGVVERALARERDAVVRYQSYAAQAENEGYPGAAALFRAQAKAEQTHATRFAAILEEHDLPLPAEQPATPKTGSTAENLRSAVSSEMNERDYDYREAVQLCKAQGAPEVAQIFDQTRDSEVEHINLGNSAIRDLSSLKEPKIYYVCGKCGYTTDVKLPLCPACQLKRSPSPVE